MYFKVSMRTNPRTDRYSGYYRLVESYRNPCDRVCHRTILNAGYLDELNTNQLNLIQKILTAKVDHHDHPLFELPYTDNPTVIHYVDEFYNRMVAEKEALEQYLSVRTNQLFDIEDRIMLYDLTNTYFEGRKEGSKLAKYGRSKEKRSDAKLVVLALVVNPEGFIKYSSILEGNMADSKTLEGMINKLRIKTSSSAKKALVVIDAGIAIEENLAMIKEKGYDYLCVSRSSLKNYHIEAGATTVTVTGNRKQKIELCHVKSDRNTDYYLKVESHSKELKERSINEQFRTRFEAGLQKIADSLTRKGGVKQEDKVYERIGRLKQKYPSIQRYFDIEIEVKDDVEIKRKETEATQEKKKIVTSIKWAIKEGVDINARSGVYFIRTSMEANS